MRNKSFKRVGAALMAAILVMSNFGGTSAVQAKESETQMSSEKEIVYVNSYSDSAREQNFDSNWKFYLGDASGADTAGFDDSSWRTVNLPHDYSIEQEYTSAGEAESGFLLGGTGWYRKHFSLDKSLEGKEIRIDFGGVYMNATVWVNGTKLGTHPYGYTPFSFDITDYVTFDGENVITVKVDHQTPSSRWYSGSGIYRSVNLTVMDKVHVDLYGTEITAPNLEAEQGGTVNMTVKTTVANEDTAAKDVVLVHTIYEKGTENSIGTVTTTAENVAAGATAEIEATLPAQNPRLWGLGEENAHLYTVVTEVKVGKDVVDTYETEFGFRYFSFDTDTGFYLNGEAMKLKGVCMHHDQGSLGSEAHYRATERQVELLQEMGCNSIRVTHNPASDALIQVANEKGILLIEEVFDGLMYPKNGNSNDYSVWFETAVEDGNQILGADAEPMEATDSFLGSVDGLSWAQFDLTATIKRGYNAPSIFMWSLGNEIWEGAGGHAQFPAVVDTLIDWATALDNTRPSTTGDNNLKGGTGNWWSYDIAESLTAAGGVVGANYCSGSNYDSIYNMYKDVKGFAFYGAETASHVNSRGVYDRTSGGSQTSDQQLTSYDYSCVGWGAVASSAWYDIITRDFMAGEYVWTGFDYIGEPTPWNGTSSGWTAGTNSPKNSYFGIIDTAGLPKDNFYFYQSQWNDEVTTLHVLPAWNEDVVVSGNVPIVVYSDAAAVELFFTGTDGVRESLGKKTFTQKTTDAGYTYQMYEGSDKSSTTHRNMYLTWYKAFEEGTIEAVAYDKSGNVITDTVGRSYVTTTGDEAKLDATVDRATIDADGKDLAYITVNVTDEDGNIVPDASNQVTFTVDGPGVLVGVDNGKQSDHQSYQDDNRAAYNGSLIAIVQSTKEAGEITVTATAAGLTSDSVTINTESTGEAAEVGFFMSKNYYVQVGKKPVLPTTIETRMPDGSTEELSVVWNEIPADAYAEAGTFSVGGVVDGQYSVAVTVNMIDEIGAILNYSTTTPVGTAVTLPESRPAVLPDGTILDVFFNVDWDDVAADAYDEVGTFVVNGTADVFGTKLDVTATIRVQEETVSIVGSVDNPLTLTEDISEDLQSDTLTAIWDGSTAIGDNNEGGRNTTAWSNYNASQAGDTTAEITFEYATQQRIGEVVIHFWKDGYAAEYPDAGTTEIYISDTGAEDSWTKVEATETLGTENGRVKAYTYSFTPVTATFIKFCLTNSTAQKTAKACTGITEIEIKKAAGTFSTYTTAGLEAMSVDGTALTANELASGEYYTLNILPAVEATGAGNAAVTVLPVYDGKVLVITESEDHKVRETFTIYVGQEAPVDPSNASKDVPVDSLIAISDSQYLPGTSNEGPDDYILDGDANTHWHTNWQTTEATDVSKRWVGVSLSEATLVDGIRYLPRNNGGTNGAVMQYEVQYRETDDGEWLTATSGTLDRTDTSWQLITFDAVMAKQVRIVGITTYADSGNNAHMSCAEFRVLQASETAVTDKTALKAAIAEAKALNADDYKDFSLVEAALSVANTVMANEAASQAAVDAATNGLKNAIAALEVKGEDPVTEGEVVRIAGAGRIDTALMVADTLKDTLGLDKFETVIIATSKTFADALPGSYLAYVENAPILLTSDARMDDVVAYVKANLVDGGKVYILGGEAAVSASLEGKLAGYDVDRLAGSGRYETNMMILDRAGVTGGEIIVATGKSFADSLSASAAKLPILMVKDSLNTDQKALLATMNVEKFYIVGGESAVSAKVADELAAYASVERVAGANRRETSIAVAQKFFENPDMAVVASASNFPDGLCGGPLAAALNAPLVLTVDGKTTEAAAYTAEFGIEAGYVLGGTGVLTDDSVVNVFALESAADIIAK